MAYAITKKRDSYMPCEAMALSPKYKKYILHNPCQDLIPHNIWSVGSLFLLRKENFYSTCRSASRKSNIKLTMRKDRSSKIKTNILDRLTLRLVDGHCKSQMNRELTT